MVDKNLKIALLVGGASAEREVSKESGKSVLYAIRERGYDVKLIDPAFGINQPDDELKFFDEKDYAPVSVANYIEAINSTLMDDIDLVFNGLHGKYGEDGMIQSLLEMRGLKYTGAKMLPSAIAMNKLTSKIMFKHFEVETPKWFVVTRNDKNVILIKDKIKKFFGYPCVIKPHNEGSTFGLTICRGEVEVENALDLALKYSDKIFVEEYIAGREMTVGVINQHVLPVLEIKPKHALYDYECKYSDGMSEYIVPADIPEKVAVRMQRQALFAYNSVECSNYGRVDFRLTNDNKMYCLEVNTLPGMTSHSLMPKMAKAAGINFNELIDRIIKYELNG